MKCKNCQQEEGEIDEHGVCGSCYEIYDLKCVAQVLGVFIVLWILVENI